MENINLLTISGYACLAGLILIIAIPVFFVIYKYAGKKNEISNKVAAERQSILNSGGVIAPASILFVTRKQGDKYANIIDFEVEVQPEGGVPFKASFRDVVGREHFSMFGGKLVGHSGRRIWVAYDPSNLSRVVLDHFDDQNELMLLNQRITEFNKLAEANEGIKARGEEAKAIISRVDDLNLQYSSQNARAMRLFFDVMPGSGSAFKSETNAWIGEASLEKYSVGKSVYVRFDPHKTEISALIRSAE